MILLLNKYQRLKGFLKFIGLLMVLLAINYAWIALFFTQQQVTIDAGQMLSENVISNEGSLWLKKNSSLNGNVRFEKGTIFLEEGARILGEIHLNEGTIETSEGSGVVGEIFVKNGDIVLGEANVAQQKIHVEQGHVLVGPHSILENGLYLTKGDLKLKEGVHVKGDVSVEDGVISKHSTATIGGKKPQVYITYDWPAALKYFDILPESHKKQVGFVILTKEKNGLIRDESITQSPQYFEGIYDYSDGRLISLNLSDPVLMDVFFKKAKEFFTELPEYRMAYFNVGATTEDFAHDVNFADIYLPASGSDTLIIHEMAHVLDFKYDFSDFHESKFPWTPEDAVSDYGATHPGEDFAEAYRLYVLNKEKFLELIEENPERQKKWEYLEEWVFGKQEAI